MNKRAPTTMSSHRIKMPAFPSQKDKVTKLHETSCVWPLWFYSVATSTEEFS
ncbi:hypothetical protein LEMLEM_LOCUS11202 [Lemmus lemmus]